MTGNMVSNADEFQASNSQAQIAAADNAPSSPCLQNPAARLFKKSPWLNDISLPLLLLLAGQISARPANAQQEAILDNIIITAQNQFGTVSQLTIRDGVLYLLEEGCHLVMSRQLGADDILIGEGGMDLFRLDLDDDGTDTVLGFTLGEDRIQIDTAFQDDFTLAELGLEIIESNDGMHAHIVNANDNSHIYMTIENIDHEDLGVTDFEII